MAPREQAVRVVTLSGKRLAATLVLAITVGFITGWLAHRPPPPTDTTALLRAFEQVNQQASQVISDAIRAGAAGPAPAGGAPPDSAVKPRN
jgi:hypothetical protein